jgi:hypothetical protein
VEQGGQGQHPAKPEPWNGAKTGWGGAHVTVLGSWNPSTEPSHTSRKAPPKTAASG